MFDSFDSIPNPDALQKLQSKEKLNFLERDELSTLDRAFEKFSELANNPKDFSPHKDTTSVFSDIAKLPLDKRADAIKDAVKTMEKNVEKVISNKEKLEDQFKGNRPFARLMRDAEKIQKIGVNKYFDEKFYKPLEKLEKKQEKGLSNSSEKTKTVSVKSASLKNDKGVNPIFSGKSAGIDKAVPTKSFNLAKGDR